MTGKSHRIVFATCAAQPDISTSDRVLAAALEHHGSTVVGAAWNADIEPFVRADCVIIRTTWDYFDHYPQFCDWLDELERQSIRVLNSLPVLRWNIRKSYLFELQDAGAPVLPLVRVEPDVPAIQQAVVDMGWSQAVLKCLVSGTARGLSLFDPESEEDIHKALDVAAPWSDYGLMVQPFRPQITEAGELSMVFTDDLFSHAVCKRPKANEFRIQSEFGGRYELAMPEPSVLESAHHCLGYVERLIGETPLYARVDGLVVDGKFELMELELAEPELMFNLAPESADTMADAIGRRLS